MKYITHAVRITLLFVLCGATAQAQVGRRTGQSERIIVPLEMPEPPTALPHVVDVEEGAVVTCECPDPPQTTAVSADAQGPMATKKRECIEPCFVDALRAVDVDIKAMILYTPDPMYTREARWNNTAGQIVLQVALASWGKVASIKVLKGLPDGLTGAAIEAACQIRFEPAMKDGRAVSQYVKVEYNFSLDDRMIGPRPNRLPPRGVPPTRRNRVPPIMLPPQPLDFVPDEESFVMFSSTGLPSRFLLPDYFLPSLPPPLAGFWFCPWPSPF